MENFLDKKVKKKIHVNRSRVTDQSTERDHCRSTWLRGTTEDIESLSVIDSSGVIYVKAGHSDKRPVILHVKVYNFE